VIRTSKCAICQLFHCMTFCFCHIRLYHSRKQIFFYSCSFSFIKIITCVRNELEKLIFLSCECAFLLNVSFVCQIEENKICLTSTWWIDVIINTLIDRRIEFRTPTFSYSPFFFSRWCIYIKNYRRSIFFSFFSSAYALVFLFLVSGEKEKEKRDVWMSEAKFK